MPSISPTPAVLATLIRLLGDFDLAEEALHEAFRAALEQWPRDGVPANPRGWLVSAGRFKGIDTLRRRSRFDALDEVGDEANLAVEDAAAWADEESVEDDQLRLIFICCHPALAPDAQVALTLPTASAPIAANGSGRAATWSPQSRCTRSKPRPRCRSGTAKSP